MPVCLSQQVEELSPEAQLLRTGEYASVVSGRHKGKYGIVQGSSKGKIVVRDC